MSSSSFISVFLEKPGMSGYDRAITVFSPDGRLFQVEYALEAVKRGTLVIGISGRESSYLMAERKVVTKLQDPRTVRKVVSVDDHVSVAFSGLQADAKVLINQMRIECQSYRLSCEDPPTANYVSMGVAKTQQSYTHRGGARPFGVSIIIIGLNNAGKPSIFQTDPSGTSYEWKATAIGRNSKTVLEHLEKTYKAGMSDSEALDCGLSSMLQVVETGAKNLEVLRCGEDGTLSPVSDELIESRCAALAAA